MSASASYVVERPIDLIQLSLEEEVFVKCRRQVVYQGTLHAYDEHVNLMLGDVEETVVNKIVNEDGTTTEEAQITHHPLLFVRGDNIILISNTFTESK